MGSNRCHAAKGHECGNVARKYPSMEERQGKQIPINICTKTVLCQPSSIRGHLSEVICN